MTLATVPRYRPDRLPALGAHAVVVGASVAGLCAARVLADGFDRVTVVERDRLPDEPHARRGVPQSNHVHVLLEAGKATLEDLFPGFRRDLLSAGGLEIDGNRDVRFYAEGDFLAAGPGPLPHLAATRPLYEWLARRHVADLDNVRVRTGCQFTDYLVDESSTTVTGVTIRNEESARETLEATLVVDATGRPSRTPAWLERHGFDPPPVDEVVIDLAYSSAFVERPADDCRAFVMPPSASCPRGAGVLPVEDDRWLVTVAGVHGDHPPTDVDGFVDFAASLPVPHVKELLEAHLQQGTEVRRYPFPSSLRRRYEDVDRFPGGLVVVGDAVASFNPLYAQGVSVAALEAVLLHHTLREGEIEAVGPRFFDRAAGTVDVAWSMAVGADFGFPETRGPRPRGTTLFNWYTSRLLGRAHADGVLAETFHRVLSMEEPPTALFRPGALWRVFRPFGAGHAPRLGDRETPTRW